jgi:hypothetical protein
MSLRIDATQLITDGFELEIAATEGVTRIELGPSGGLTGRYQQDAERIILRQLSAKSFLLNRIEIPLSGGLLEVRAPSSLREVSIDVELPKAEPGAVRGRAELAGATLHVALDRRPLELTSTLELESVAWERTAELEHAQLGKAELSDLRVVLHGRVIRVGRLSLSGVRFSRSGSGELSLHCEDLHAHDVVLEQQSLLLELDEVRLPAGFRLEGDVLTLLELEIGRVRASLPELTKRRPAPARPASANARRTSLPDLPLLDHVQGQLHVDVTLDVSLPVIKSRRATHSFRLPIEHGTINFKQLERCLAGLEDAVLDFEVTKDALIFERDLIPGISIDNQTLVSWSLAGKDHDLAKQEQRVRLRKLLDYRVNPALRSAPANPQQAAKQPSSALRRLEVDVLEVALSLGGPSELTLPALGTVRLGGAGQAAVASLKLTGKIQHASDQSLPPTQLSLSAGGVRLGASLPDLAGRKLELGALSVQQIGARLRFHGLQPDGAALDAERIHLSRLEVRGLLDPGA